MTYNLDAFTGKDIVFVGVGQGRAAAGVQQFLEKHAQLKSFSGVDKKPGNNPLGFLKEYDQTSTMFIKNEGIPGHEMPVPYVTAMQLFFRMAVENNLQTIGITGTKGKSTTTSLTAHILDVAGKHIVLAGNIGVSPLLSLDEANGDTIFVLELSSYQLSDMTVSPHVSACINLYNDHMDWHGSLEAYWEAKHNIMRFAGPNDTFIYNPDFAALQNWVHDAKCQTIAIDPHEQLDLSGAKLFGDHNRLNALVAREIARKFDITDEQTQTAINSFQPLEHRMEVVATVRGRTYVDDAIGMTPESTLASMKAVTAKFGPIGCLLLGGQDRHYDFGELMKTVAELQIPNLVFFPETDQQMKDAMPTSYSPQIFDTRSMQDAVAFASEHAPENSVVLLSTAAPSYVLWKDFPDKGNQFKAAVSSLD